MEAISLTRENGQSAYRLEIDLLSSEVEAQVIAWRRDIHQHPELPNREFRTAKLVAEHLRKLDIEVQTEVAHTGVVGILRGAKNGPAVALRADMDALPVTEATGLPFASEVKAIYRGQEVGVMHACGHDAHTAILMGAAQVLSALREQLPGTVKFIFQPAEEGAPDGEEGGAGLMIREGALENPTPDAILGLHVFPGPVGTISYRPGAIMASVNDLRITVQGRQTHGAMPWGGVDPIVVASQIVLGLQTIVSRQVDPTAVPSIISIGSIHGGVRSNIIPDQVEMLGTIRTFDPKIKKEIHQRIRSTATLIAESAGATAQVEIGSGLPAVYNDLDLTQRLSSVLEKTAGKDNLLLCPPNTGAEDFARYQQQIPGLFLFLGITSQAMDPKQMPMNHSPHFDVDEKAFILGVRALAHMAFAYLESRDDETG